MVGLGEEIVHFVCFPLCVFILCVHFVCFEIEPYSKDQAGLELTMSPRLALNPPTLASQV